MSMSGLFESDINRSHQIGLVVLVLGMEETSPPTFRTLFQR